MLTINQLWLVASKGKFGFSVQKQIWVRVGGKPGQYDSNIFWRFLEEVEWAENEIVFDQRAAKGHLPVGVFVKVSDDLRKNKKWCWQIDKIVKTSEEERDQLEEERGQLRKRLESERKLYIQQMQRDREWRDPLWEEWEKYKSIRSKIEIVEGIGSFVEGIGQTTICGCAAVVFGIVGSIFLAGLVLGGNWVVAVLLWWGFWEIWRIGEEVVGSFYRSWSDSFVSEEEKRKIQKIEDLKNLRGYKRGKGYIPPYFSLLSRKDL